MTNNTGSVVRLMDKAQSNVYEVTFVGAVGNKMPHIQRLGRMRPTYDARIIVADSLKSVADAITHWREFGTVPTNFERRLITTRYHSNLFAWVENKFIP